MSKKVLGALLAVVMVISVFSVSAFAVRADEYEPADTTYKSNWTISCDGSSATITVTANYALGAISFKLLNASNIQTNVTVTGYYDAYLATASNASGEVFIIPDSPEDGAGSTPVLAENTTVTIKVNCTTNASTAIDPTPKSAMNPAGTLVAARLSGTTVENSNIIMGQLANVAGQEVVPPTIPEEEEPTDVTLTGAGTGYVDEVRNYVYGVPARTKDLTPYFAATGTGVIEIVPTASYNSNSGYGTGTVINLYSDSSKSSLVGSYTLIIFGDVNGDALVQIKDAKSIQDYANAVNTNLTDIAKFAANVNGDVNKNGELLIQIKDAKAVQDYANAVNTNLSVNPWAS